MIRYAFDFDCTLTTVDTYALLAQALGLGAQVDELTRQALCGEQDFTTSLRQRFALLGRASPEQVRAIFDQVELDPDLSAFILARPQRCAVISNNLDLWLSNFAQQLGCAFYTWRANWDGKQTRISQTLDKAQAARAFKGQAKLVAIGDSLADLPMFAAADYAIAHAAVHQAPPQLALAVQRQTQSGRELAQLLNEIEARGDFPPWSSK